MSLLRNESEIETYKNACPICHNDVKGNDIVLYFCSGCNILFRKDDLILERKVVESIIREKIAQKFDKDALKLEQEPIIEKALSEKNKEIIKDLERSKKYYISKKSNILHVSNCPYGKNIKKENKIILRSLDGTEHLKRCRCMSD